MKRRGSGRKPVLDLNSKSDSPVRQSWQTKYQQICQEQNGSGGSGEGSPAEVERADSPKKKRRLSADPASTTTPKHNPLKGLLGQYNSDEDDDEAQLTAEEADGNGGLDAKVEDFLKEIQEIAPLEKPKKKKKTPLPTKSVATAAKPKEVQPDASQLQSVAVAAVDGAALQPTVAWQECFDEGTGYAYYWNMHTNEVTWQMPPEYQQYLVVLEAWQRQQALLAAGTAAVATDASQQPQSSKKKSEKNEKSTKNKQLDKRKSKKSDDSSSEDEKIELITSYGQSSSDDSDSDEEVEASKPSAISSRPQLGLGRPFQEGGDKRPLVNWDSMTQNAQSTASTIQKTTLPKSRLKKNGEDELSATPKGGEKSTGLSKAAEKSTVLPKLAGKSSVISKTVDKPSNIVKTSVTSKESAISKVADEATVISKVADKPVMDKLSNITDKSSVSSKVADKPLIKSTLVEKTSATDDKKLISATVDDKTSIKSTSEKLTSGTKSVVKDSVIDSETKSAVKLETASHDSKSDYSKKEDIVKQSTIPKPTDNSTSGSVLKNSEALERLKKLKRKAAESDSSSSSSSSEDIKNEDEDDDDDDDDDDIDESDILARLKDQANILKELGGEVPDSIKALISGDAPSSFSLIAGYGDSDGEDEKEVEKGKHVPTPASEPSPTPPENKPLFPIMDAVKKEEESKESPKLVEKKDEDEQSNKRELDEARSAANRKVIKLSARARALIKNSVTTAKARATDFVQTEQGLKPAKLVKPDDKSQGTKDTQSVEEIVKPPTKPEPDTKKKSKSKPVAAVASTSSSFQSIPEPSTMAGIGKISATSASSSGNTDSVNKTDSGNSSLAYTTTWSYGTEHPSGERRGFGFSTQQEPGSSKTEKKTGKKGGMIQFIKSDTVLNEPVVERAPVILDEKKLLSKTVTAIDPATQATLKDLATIIKEKTAFLSEGKDPISAVQVMSIQLEMLTNAWNENALSSDYYNNWLTSVTRQLTSLEMAATPLNWACFWDRSHKRYYYRNTVTGLVQWEYPVLVAETAASGETAPASSEGDDNMDLCTTPPPPAFDDDELPPTPPAISCSPPPPPPPPPNISGGDGPEQRGGRDTTNEQPQPPPPPMISEDDFNAAPPPPPPPQPPLPPTMPPLPPPPPSDVSGTGASYAHAHYTSTTSTPPAPASDPNLSLELSSFYSDIAALDPPPLPPSDSAAPVPPPPPPDSAPLPPLPPPPASQPPLPPPPSEPPLPPTSTSTTKKKKKPKLGTGLSLKKRGYSSLMEKWQQIAAEEGEDDSK